MKKKHSINTVSKISGLQSIVIRTWENRYNAVTPARTESNHRLYSDEDIDKLATLKKLTSRGYKIGKIASLQLNELNSLLIKDKVSQTPLSQSNLEIEVNDFENILQQCLDRIKVFDSKGLEKNLADASVNFSLPVMIDKIIFPLIEKVGNYWKGGEFRISHEHFTSAILRKLLSNISDGYNIQQNAPNLIVTTPHGQYHEIGSLIGSSLAASDGWRITYLGPSLPAEEIAYTAKQCDAKVIFLSIVYPNDDMQLMTELRKLNQLVGNQTHIIVNGNAVKGYINVLSEINASVVTNSEQFRKTLELKRNLINAN